MKKKYACEVDCANCAAKVEEAMKRVPGVKSVSVNFLTQKVTIEADEDGFDAIVKDAFKAGKHVESDFEMVIA